MKRLQQPDGGWPFRVVGSGCAGPFGSCPNTFGVIGLGLLAADQHTGGTALRPAAIEAGDALIARYQAAIAQTPQTLPFNQDIEFLVELSTLTGNPVYATTARAWFQVAIDRFPNAAHRIDDFIERRKPGRVTSVAAWDAASFIRAAKAAGDLDYALAAAVRTRQVQPPLERHESGAQERPVRLFRPAVARPTTRRRSITRSWAKARCSGRSTTCPASTRKSTSTAPSCWQNRIRPARGMAAYLQVTAYVTIGLQAVGGTGTSAAITAAANFFLAQQLPTGGWPFSTGNSGEYGAVNAEVNRAMSTLFSTRAGANVAVAPAQLLKRDVQHGDDLRSDDGRRD